MVYQVNMIEKIRTFIQEESLGKKMSTYPRIVILGAGPTGLGALHRLTELEVSNVHLYERKLTPGGLAASFTDEHNFVWDIGGHVLFSHYEYFDNLMKELLQDRWLHHQRESWVWYKDRFIPYPFQYNIRHLPEKEMRRCLRGLLKKVDERITGTPENFREWILDNFGEGIADIFMFPYNYKVWAWPPETLSASWMGERVARVSAERTVFNILDENDDVSWGPNNTFSFPRFGGTGNIWSTLANSLPEESQHYGYEAVRIDTKRKSITFANGEIVPYDWLISTMPLDLFVKNSDLPSSIKKEADTLVYSSVHVIGIGLKGSPPPKLSTKCWMYFPEDTSPFYRATVFSNYSPHNTPDGTWSIMVEVSESTHKNVDETHLKESVVKGLVNTSLIESEDDVLHLWTFKADHGYPTPFLGRDQVIDALLPELESRNILSRGRFGAWKYEVSNQDHSLMQGVEAVDRIVSGLDEDTLFRPGYVNSGKKIPANREKTC